jgi:hypothetical protein
LPAKYGPRSESGKEVGTSVIGDDVMVAGVREISSILVEVGETCPGWGLHANNVKTMVNDMMKALAFFFIFHLNQKCSCRSVERVKRVKRTERCQPEALI